MNFQITQGTGTTIATDTGGGGENYQKIKLIDATPGSTAGAGISSNPFWIQGTLTSNIGTTGGLALDSSINGILLQQGSITSGQFGPLIMGAVSTGAPSYATGQTSPLSLTPAGSLRVSLDNFPSTFATNLTAVGGTPFALGQNTMANSVSVTLASNQTPIPPTPASDVPVTGTLTSLVDTVVIDCHGLTTLGWTTSGTWSGTQIMELEYGDGQWYQVEVIDTAVAGGAKPFVVTSWTESLNNDPWITNVGGAVHARIRFTVYNSGTANIVFNGSVANNAVRTYNLNSNMFLTQAWNRDGLGNALTSTTIGPKQALDVNIAGGVTIDVNLDHTTDNVLVYGNDGVLDQKILTNAAGAVQVDVLNFPATVAVTQSTSPWVVSLASTTITGTVAVTQSGVWSIGRTWTLASGTDSVAAVQSGTWNINNISGTISLPTGAATEATLSTRLADATFTARVNTLGQKTMANSTPVVLSSDQSAIPVSQSGTWTVQPGNTANTTPWLTTINQGGNSATVTGANALKVDGSAVTQPVSGTVTANQGGAPWAENITQIAGSAVATAAAGIAKVGVTDGSGNAITSTVVSATRSIDTNQTQAADGYASAQNQVFTTSVDFTLPTGGTETPAIFLKNPNASGKTLIIKKIIIYGVSTNNNGATIRIYSNPTTSADGTGQTESTTSIGSGATAVATAFTGPTVTGGANGARLLSLNIK